MTRIQINVLTTYNSPNSLALIYPLLVNRTFFDACGIKFNFYGRITSKTADCDVLFVNSKVFRTWHAGGQEKLYDTLSYFKKRVRKVVWFDTTDSTGTTQFNVMPFVDGYYKGQVLRDRSLYEKLFYGNRIFTDYYKRLFGLSDGEDGLDEQENGSAVSTLLQKEHAHKLGISWNSAMNDWGTCFYNYTYTGLIARLRSRLPLKVGYKARFIKPDTNRKVMISGRIGLSHTRNTVRDQREKITELLREKFDVGTSVVPRGRYINELKSARIAVSPYGLGEISCRDFEIIINGALMFKQDVSHMETWPPLYANNKTYMPFSWDLCDLEEKITAMLSDSAKRCEISQNAQILYEKYLYGDGRQEFCKKVTDIIG